ncbi:MAG TPA: hypothetical protein VGB83_06790 [Actinomycetota bacterium]
MTRARVGRRDFLRLLAAGVGGVAIACSRGPATPAPSGLSLFPGGQEYMVSPAHRFSFGLADEDGASVEDGSVQARVLPGGDWAPAEFLRYRRPGPNDPAGFYRATLPFARAGVTDVEIVRGGARATAAVQVREAPSVPGVGDPAVPVATPTTRNPRGVAAVCTRTPQCGMHEQRLDHALGAGTPVVLTIASPKLCRSRTCGPVVDEVRDVRRAAGASAAFVHAEVYATDTATTLSPTSEAWRLESEPWTFVIDPEGVIRARFEGPVAADEIAQALASA